MIKLCPKCRGTLILEDRVLFCIDCLYVVDRFLKREKLDDDIRSLRSKGLSWASIGKRVNRTAMAVRRRFIIAFGKDHELMQDIQKVKDQKETTLLSYLMKEDGLSYSFISKELGISINACKQKVRRERMKL